MIRQESRFRHVPLSEISRPISRPVSVAPGEKYRTFGVRWWGEGAYERETIDGAETSAKTLFLIRVDDLVINKIWVRHGSVAIAGAEVDGCAASGEFPTFALDQSQVTPRWVYWYTKMKPFWEACGRLSQGTSGKNRIRPDRFLDVEIPLPPLSEQQRIVARIDALAGRIEEAKGLRKQAIEEVEAVCRAIIFDERSLPESIPMYELVRLKRPDTTVLPNESYTFAGVYSFGRGVFRGKTLPGSATSYASLTLLSEGNFVYPKLMAWEGALGTVPSECHGCFVSPEFPVFLVNENRVLAEVLDYYFRTPSVWPKLSEISTGTNVRRRRLHPESFLKYEFPLPSMTSQLTVREIHEKLKPIRKLQAETQAELEALLPAVLDRAFRGEL